MNTEESINQALEDGSEETLRLINNGYHYLRSLVTRSAKKKDLISIDYKTDLSSDIRLDPVYYFTNDGLIDKTIYFYDEKPVLEVQEIYKYNSVDEQNTSMNISKRGIHSRKKIWKYYFENGSLDSSNKEGTFKIKEKFYRTDIEGLVVGQKRRHNISIILSQRAGTLLVILGKFSDSKEVKDAMRSISAQYSSNFQEYEKYGTENIIDDILNDKNYPWLDTYIPTDANLADMVIANQINYTTKAIIQGAFQKYNLTNIQGMTIRNYFCEKLKGNIN